MHRRWLVTGVLFIAGVLTGATIVLGMRFITYAPDEPHYHANFALYINGQREAFKGAQYYEEETMCAVHASITPMGRAHMHDNINTVVHVEDHAVTWGQFFTNLGWTLGPTFIAAPDGTIYAEQGNSKLNLLLNNQDYTDLGGVANTVIKDHDKLLISYGNESQQTLQHQYATIPSTAHHYDITPDPQTCSGQTTNDIQDRLQHLF